MPVVNYEAMRRIFVDPLLSYQGCYQCAGLTLPLHPSLDLSVAIFPDVPLWGESPTEVPEAFQRTHSFHATDR
jgi:hypothetical protein